MAQGNGAGGGPPKGSSSDYAGAQQIPLDDLAKQVNDSVGGGPIPPFDPAFPPPRSPLGPTTKALARLVRHRDIPLVTIQNNWDPPTVRAALATHNAGIFERSAQAVDSMLGDDRVQATLGSRVGGLFGREVRFRPANDSDAAKECLAAWVEQWPDFFTASLVECHVYGIMMGFSPAQLFWDTTGEIWTPQLRPWHPRYTYYNWDVRKLVALSLDGAYAITPGDAKWVLHAPYGEYRGWIRGAVRAIAEPWLFRHYAIRDWARFSEVHGIPTRIGIVPASSDPEERDAFFNSLANLGVETTMICPEGVDARNGGNSYDVKLLEATDQAWEAFPGLRDHCDMAIVLALKFQNLTTEIQSGGSYAAAAQHGQVAVQQEASDNAAWRTTIREQVAKPFAFINFGDASLAPWTDWDVKAQDAYKENAEQFSKFGLAIEVLRRGGVKFKDVEELRKFASRLFGLDGLPDFDIVDPVSGGLGGGK